MPARLDTGADSIHPSRNHKQRRLDRYRHALADAHPHAVVQAPFPPAVQGYYSNNPRSNTKHIRQTLDKALHRAGLLNAPLTRLPQTGNLLIPSSEADAHHPKYWAARISALLTRSAQDAVLDTLQSALRLGCRPFVKGIERTDGGSAHHPGIFLKPSQLKTPWVSRDTLQPHSNPRVTSERREAMLALCAAVDKVANTAVKRHMRRLDEPTYRRHHRVKRLLKIGEATGGLDTRGLSLDDMPNKPRQMDETTELLRFGNIATCLAFANGQSEKLHLDLHDDRQLYTTLLVLGRQGADWDRSTGRGDLLLPTLGLAMPLYPGDILFFQPALLPHAVNPLSAAEVTHRTVITMFNCEPTTDYLEKHCATLA